MIVAEIMLGKNGQPFFLSLKKKVYKNMDQIRK